MNRNRSLVCKEPELAREIARLRKELFDKERRLFLKLEELASVRAAAKDFYAKVYLPRLGPYIQALEEAKADAIGLPGRAKKRGADLPGPPREEEKELPAQTKKELKDIYRRLARLYHPDRPHEKDEREFLTARMAEINEAFRKGDLDALKRYLRRADAEIGVTLSSLERIRCLEMEGGITDSLDRVYAARVADAKKNEIYKLLKKDAASREEVFRGLEDRFRFEIGVYRRILARLGARAKRPVDK